MWRVLLVVGGGVGEEGGEEEGEVVVGVEGGRDDGGNDYWMQLFSVGREIGLGAAVFSHVSRWIRHRNTCY